MKEYSASGFQRVFEFVAYAAKTPLRQYGGSCKNTILPIFRKHHSQLLIMRKLLTLLMLISFITTLAQKKFGIITGLNVTNMKEKFDNKKHLREFIPRILVGTILEIPIGDNWMLHTSPYYSGKGCRYGLTLPSFKKDSIRIHLSYMELPVQMMYKFPSENVTKFLLGGGLYIGYGFNGVILYKNDPARTERHLHKEDSYYKRWDFGYSLNSSYQFNNKYGIKLSFSHSLLNLYRNGDADNKAKNLVFGVSLFGFIGKEKKEDNSLQ